MLTGVKIGDNVVGYPFGNGKVTEIDKERGKYRINVSFVNCKYIVTFSQSGHNVEWQTAPSCWTIKNAPGWIWDYFEKPIEFLDKSDYYEVDEYVNVLESSVKMIKSMLNALEYIYRNTDDPKIKNIICDSINGDY